MYFQDSQKTPDTFDCSDFTAGFYFVVVRACGVNNEQIIKTKPKTLYQASFCAKTSLSLRHRLQPQFKDETDRNSCISCQKTQHWLYLSHLLCKRCFKGKLLSSHSTVLIFQRWNIWSNSHRSLFKSAHWNDKYLSRLLRWHE